MIINRLSRKQRRTQLGIGSKPMNLAIWKLEEREREKERGGGGRKGETERERNRETEAQR